MTRLEAACDAYHRSFGHYPDYHAMKSALDVDCFVFWAEKIEIRTVGNDEFMNGPNKRYIEDDASKYCVIS